MSDTQSIYKSVLGLNKTGGTLFLVSYVQYRREALVHPYDQQVHVDHYHCNLVKGATHLKGIDSNLQSVKITGLAPSSYLRHLFVDQLLEMRINSAFSNNSRILEFKSIMFMVKLFDIHISVLYIIFNVKHIQPSNIKKTK